MIGIHVTNGAYVAALQDVDLSMDWSGAACVGTDPDMWFPEKSIGSNPYGEPREICEHCPIRERCLEYAMRREATAGHAHRAGMWGGLTPDERWQLARERRSG